MFLKFAIAVLSIYLIDFHEIWQNTLSVSLTNYPANFIEIDEIDAEHCNGKLQKYFPQFLTEAVFPSNLSIDRDSFETKIGYGSGWKDKLKSLTSCVHIRKRHPNFGKKASTIENVFYRNEQN